MGFALELHLQVPSVYGVEERDRCGPHKPELRRSGIGRRSSAVQA